MDTQRLILFFIFGFSLLLLWDAWEKHNRPKPVPPAPAAQSVPAAPTKPAPSPSSPPAATAATTAAAAAAVPAAAPLAKGEVLRIKTDLLIAEIDTLGGTLSRVELLKHKQADDTTKDLVLLGAERHYSAQSGLAGAGGPNHRTLWQALPGPRELAPGQDKLEVRLRAQGDNGIAVEKTYVFSRDSYVVDVVLQVSNRGAAPAAPYAYFQLTHDGKLDSGAHTIAQSFGAQSFAGFATYTEDKKYQKIHFADLDKDKAEYAKNAQDGWVGFVQHYFVAAWLPAAKQAREYVVERRQDGTYAGRVVLPIAEIAPGASARLSVPLYAGPQEQRRLKAAAPGLDLVVDYGWLAVIAWPLFWLLEKFHGLTGNWGVAIILLTVTIKLLFFPLSAASYKSMAKMKLITPRLTKIREMYANDRARMNQAMMELYKTEKINPLGGCFPILVQIPVFIALYWTLLAAIELRHAPFIFWIKDLAALDPYYVLPVLMTATMVLQTRMNPVPPDPVQAKVMQFMPYVFSVFFFFFPAGLVLYWLVNNILSIAQQWQIQRMFDRDKTAHARR
jgi:YidC/Oxa1 family membrane protein insertase